MFKQFEEGPQRSFESAKQLHISKVCKDFSDGFVSGAVYLHR